ncbi:MAG: hypothetical protein NW237_16295 [Cyanobacteriota bacterium]|nr:hypothetical protein [Cyanobacteriota bacterium]
MRATNIQNTVGDWRSLWLGIALLGLIWLSGCGAKAPQSVVQQALNYQMTHAPAALQAIVGYPQLQETVQIKDVKVKRDQTLTLPTGLRQKLEAHQLTGTYTLTIPSPQKRRGYQRRGEPFQLTLAQVGEPKTWQLVSPLLESVPPLWATQPFLPEPPPPSVSPTPSPDPEVAGESTSPPESVAQAGL